MAIDIGAAAIDRASTFAPNVTLIALDNPANASGTITNVEIWAGLNMSNCVVGTFFLVSGTTYECRDSEAIGSVTAGSKQSFSVTIDVEAGDYIGIYYTSGRIERDTLGGSGVYGVNGEYIDPGDQASYTLFANNAISLYGTGTEGGQTHYGSATLSGVGTLAGVGALTAIGQAILSGVGTLSAIGNRTVAGVVSLAGFGTLSAIGSRIIKGTSILTGVGSLSAIGQVITGGIVYGAATLAGAGLLVSKSILMLSGKATMSSIGTLAVLGRRLVNGIATLSGVGSLTAAGRRIVIGIATLTGIGTLSAAAQRLRLVIVRAVFDICYFDEVIFDYGVCIAVTPARLDIVIGNKSVLAIDTLAKANLETIIGEKVRMTEAIGTKANMLVASGSKSSLDIELLGGGL